ncbi:hypothetical protein LCGC14_0945140, partial [marine sediment metagenome]
RVYFPIAFSAGRGMVVVETIFIGRLYIDLGALYWYSGTCRTRTVFHTIEGCRCKGYILGIDGQFFWPGMYVCNTRYAADFKMKMI